MGIEPITETCLVAPKQLTQAQAAFVRDSAEIKAKERWEHRDVEREDINAEEGTFEAAAGGREIKKVSVLVGAEQERLKLTELLKKKADALKVKFREMTKQIYATKMAVAEQAGGARARPRDAAAQCARVMAAVTHRARLSEGKPAC